MTNTQRIDIGDQHPAAYKALITLSTEVGAALLPRASTRS